MMQSNEGGITTERLYLRSRTLADLEPIVEMDADPEVRRYYHSGPLDPQTHREEVREHILSGIPKYQWAIEWRNAPGFLGKCSLSPLADTGLTQIGWRLPRFCWGQGIATEAAAAILDYARTALAIDPVVAVIHPENRPSIRVAEKIGLRLVGTGYYYHGDKLVYSNDPDTQVPGTLAGSA